MPRYMPDEWPLPELDATNRPFFTSGRLLIQQCSACATLQHPPEEVCHHCQGIEFGSVQCRGTATIQSYVVVHHPTHPLLKDRVPYGVALVQLEDHPEIRILGNVLGLEPAELAIGLPVEVVFEEVTDENGEHLALPQWRAVQETR